MSSLSALTEQLRVAMLTYEAETPPLSPEARASGLERTLGIPKGAEGVPSGRAKKARSKATPPAKLESITSLLRRGEEYLVRQRAQ